MRSRERGRVSQLYKTIIDFLDHFAVEYEDSNPKIMADILGIKPESYLRKVRDARDAVRRAVPGVSTAEGGVLHLFSNEQLSRFSHATYVPYEMLVRLNAGLPVFYDFGTNRYTTAPGHDQITAESIARSVTDMKIRTMCRLADLEHDDFTKAVGPHLGRFLETDIAFGWREYEFLTARVPQ